MTGSRWIENTISSRYGLFIAQLGFFSATSWTHLYREVTTVSVFFFNEKFLCIGNLLFMFLKNGNFLRFLKVFCTNLSNGASLFPIS